MQPGFRVGPLVFLLVLCFCHGFAQNLEQLPPVLKDVYTGQDSALSFVFTALDFRQQEIKKPQKYANCVQIFDADISWPPRWYYAIPFVRNDSAKQIPAIDAVGDARFQHGYFTFSRVKKELGKNKGNADGMAGYLICNQKMQPFDTAKSVPANTIDPHDFRINERGERLLMANMDTVLDISKASGNPADTAVVASVSVIEILDSTNKLIFRWNSAAMLGANTVYYPDLGTRTYFKQKHMDWSHGTAALWDSDGDILYSLRYVGVGKISRQDGHVIWRLDRRNMPSVAGTDTVEFYAQHDLEAISDTGDYNYYSLFSDGRWPDHLAAAVTFKVNKLSHEIKPVNKLLPDEPMVSGGAGNYEAYENGSYLLSYGQYPQKDSTEKYHYFMELRDRHEKVRVKYQLPALVFTYKVHRVTNERPPRPLISGSKTTLQATGDMSDWTWYRLSGANNTTVQKVSEGETFAPKEYGWYCVAGKYGIGWSVSKPFLFDDSLGNKKLKNKK